jgi:hypothetical protein
VKGVKPGHQEVEDDRANHIFCGAKRDGCLKGTAYDDSRKIILPNSGITVRAAIYYWQDWLPTDKGDATVP